MVDIKENYLDIFSSGLVVLAGSILTFFAIYGNPFFRDYVILFDGGYRIFSGLKPFVDFALFPIPISFYIQAFFDKFFGPNLVAMAFHSIILSSIVSIIFYFIIKKHFNRFFSILFSIAFYYSFFGIIGFPWYNQAAFFFFLLNFFLIYFDIEKNFNKNWVLTFSALLAILSIFSKIEIGLIQFLLFSIYFFMTIKNKKDIFTKYVLPFSLAFILINQLIRIVSSKEIIWTSGAIFRRIFDTTLSIFTIDQLVYSFSFYFLVFIIYFFLSNYRQFTDLNMENKKLFYLIVMLNLFILAITLVSGQQVQTKIFALPMNLFLCYLFWKNVFSLGKIVSTQKIFNFIAIFFIFMVILMQFNGISTYQDSFFKSPTRQAYNIFFLENTKYIREDFGCYRGVIHEKKYFDDLKKIRKYIQENNQDFVVMGSYAFLYCDYKIPPPEGLPLWLHEGLTFNKEKNLEDIEKYFSRTKPKLVIEQIYASNETREEFGKALVEMGYEDIDQLYSEYSSINIYQLKE